MAIDEKDITIKSHNSFCGKILIHSQTYSQEITFKYDSGSPCTENFQEATTDLVVSEPIILNCHPKISQEIGEPSLKWKFALRTGSHIIVPNHEYL